MNTLVHVSPIKLLSISDEAMHSFQSSTIKILLNLKGQTLVSVNNTSCCLNPNDILTVNAYDTCTVFKSNSLMLVLTVEKNQLKLNEEDARAYFVCDSTQFKNKDKFITLKNIVFKLFENINSVTQTKALAVAYEIYDELLNNFTMVAPAARKTTSKIIEILDYIKSNYADNLLLNDIAEKFGLSVPYLSKLFKDSTGMTFADFYDELRVNHSMYDLMETTSTIIDIAYKHGFPNNHAYIRAFKKITGRLPTDARKNRRAEQPAGELNDDLKEIINIVSHSEIKAKEYKDYYITENYNKKPLFRLEHNPGHEILGIGPAVSILHRNVQDVINYIQKNYPFRYAYIRGIFSDAFSFCTRNFDGELVFKFAMTDEVLDFLISVNLMPVLSFTYMPKDLATENKDTLFQDGYYICGPTDLNEWKLAIDTFVNHVISRYGFENVKKWIFLPWVQLDSKNRHLGFRDEHTFFNFYRASYTAVKNISPELTVSSPEIYPSQNKDWLDSFFAWTKQNDCFPDLLSVKFFPNTNWEVIEVKDSHGLAYRKVINEEISSDENLMRKALTDLKRYLHSNGYDLDIYITAFNFTITDSHPLLDTMFSASYYIKNYVDNMDLIKSLCYWRLTDDTDAGSTRQNFSGQVGMYLPNGMPKGTAQALRQLYYTKNNIIDRGAFYLLSKMDDKPQYFHLLLFNYEHPSQTNKDYFAGKENCDLYSVFLNKEKKSVHLTINDVPFKRANIKMFIINTEHGSPYDKWISMGMPEIDSYSERGSVIFDIFKVSAIPDFKTMSMTIEDNTFNIDLNLDIFEVKAVEIQFYD